jgi:hypothetical protein
VVPLRFVLDNFFNRHDTADPGSGKNAEIFVVLPSAGGDRVEGQSEFNTEKAATNRTSIVPRGLAALFSFLQSWTVADGGRPSRLKSHVSVYHRYTQQDPGFRLEVKLA